MKQLIKPSLLLIVFALVGINSFAQTKPIIRGTGSQYKTDDKTWQIPQGTELILNKEYWSLNKRYKLILQSDGNLVLYKVVENGKYHRALWATNTNGRSVKKCILNPDGNLVLYNWKDKPIWDAKSNMHQVTNAHLNGNFYHPLDV